MEVPVDPAQHSGADATNGHAETAKGAETTPGSASKEDHEFQKAISAWRNVGLGGLMPELDSAATSIVDNQKEALAQRKELAQKTKDFRKLDDSAKAAEVKGLLKVYQNYIDLLTGHEKKSTSAFLQLYTPVSEAPDPYPLLEASVDSLLVSEDTVPRLNSENEQLKRQVNSLTRDLESTEKRLQEERTTRKSLEEKQEAKAKEVEATWKGILEESKGDWEAKEKALEEKVANHDRLVEELKANYEVSQRLGEGAGENGAGHQSYASAAELEIVSSDLERTTQRLAEMQAKNEQLRMELAEASSNAKKVNLEDEPDFVQLRTENASMLRKLDAAKLDKESQARQFEGRLKGLEKDTNNLKQERENLQSKLFQWRDYPDIKRELEVFKAIELSTEDDDGAALKESLTDGDDKANGAPAGGKDSLEQLLLARNKKLNNDLAELRVSQQELQTELDTLKESATATSAELERTQKLNATLENDLTTLQQEASNTFSSARSAAGRGYAPSSFATRTRKSSPTSSIISGFSPYDNVPPSASASLDSLRSGEAVGGGSGILPMVQAQRDRFKKKNSELEGEVQKQHQTISSLRQEVASLQRDNLNLYEKTRFTTTHQRSSANAYAPAPSSSSSTAFAAGGSVEERYRPSAAYDSSLSATSSGSALTAFRGREAARAYKRLSRPERAVFSLARLVLAGRTSRNIFAAYCVALHVLIFLMLYWMQGLESAHHVGAAAASVAGSMAAKGGGSGSGLGSGSGGPGGGGAGAGAGAFKEDTLEKGAL